MLMTPEDRHRSTLEEHRAVFEAIRSGESEAARAAMRNHLDHTAVMLELFARQNPARLG
ncbi:FCD domain-containing protein [Mesorhizobium sp. M0601]